MSVIMKTIDERERKKKTKTERHRGVVQVIVKVWELNGFVAHLN